MPYTHEDYERQFGPGWPNFYTTPADWSKCKNLNLNGATPCWHPHCDCQAEPLRKMIQEDVSLFFQPLKMIVRAVRRLFERNK
jgi:hypothetical protein